MVKKIDHIAVAVKDLDEAAKFYTETLGLEMGGVEEVASQKVKVAFFNIGDTRIELVQPLDDSSGIAKAIAKRGPGLHHIALEVEDVNGELDRLGKQDVPLVDKTGRPGAHRYHRRIPASQSGQRRSDGVGRTSEKIGIFCLHSEKFREKRFL